jgi:hypothetical protein
MKLIKNRILRFTFLIFIVTPLVAWFTIKPVRLIAPQLTGIKCFEGGLCLENEEDFEDARKLRIDAIKFLSKEIGLFDSQPKVIFCSTWECAKSFGLGKRSAVTFAAFGTAISPRAWKPYYIRHELIHQLQAQELGVIKCLLLPSWLIEGMAYSLSQDPREPLTHPWEDYRAQFDEWLAGRDVSILWAEAAKEL